jgi:ATP-GRASP peptide maturase of grasp-with-spasm system
MICIISTSDGEESTDDVMQWLGAWNVPCVRFNGQSLSGEGEVCLTISREGTVTSIRSGATVVDPSRITVVWYRRWAHSELHHTRNIFVGLSDTELIKASTTVTRHLDWELRSLSRALFNFFPSATFLTDPRERPLLMNKLKVLHEAATCGLDIPDTLVSTERDRIQEFRQKHGRVITKPIGEALVYEVNGTPYGTYTTLLNDAMIQTLPKSGFPILVQEQLQKAFDIRVFYLDSNVYSMAIFSQLRTRTTVDFRQYDFERPARTVPYSMPAAVTERLRRLMNLLQLETGSIDFVKTTDGRIVFLEVNPIGQFGMVSQPCNYHLERAIAEALVRRWRNSYHA